MILFVIGTWSLVIFSSCSLRKPATAITADILTRGMVQVESEEDLFVAREAALPLLKILEVLHWGDPDNKKFLGLLAKAYGNYAFGFGELEMMKCPLTPPPIPPPAGKNPLPRWNGGRAGVEGCAEDWTSRIKRFYARGRDYGANALSRGGRSIREMPLPEFEKFLKRYGKKDVPALFWTAFNWGSYINMSRDDIIAAADLPRVEMMADRALEINPGFQCGAVHAFKGSLIAGNPFRMIDLSGGPHAGEAPVSRVRTGEHGRLAAKAHFDKALSYCGGAYLMTKVMYAEWYARGIGDKRLFSDLLSDVISADTSLLPQYRLANEIAKERAKLLLKL